VEKSQQQNPTLDEKATEYDSGSKTCELEGEGFVEQDSGLAISGLLKLSTFYSG